MAKSIYRLGVDGERPLTPLTANASPVIQALRYGITAPSAHNTQPWRIEPVSNTEARLFFDPKRLLPATDPPGRQVHISHGTLLEMTAIAATHLGYRAEIELLPEGTMSIEAFGTKPTARLRLVADPHISADSLFSQILRRRSSRLAHTGPPVTPHERSTIEEQAAKAGVAVGWIPAERRSEAVDIAVRAMAIEVNHPHLYEETRQWFRFSDDEITEHGDGLDLDTSGLSGLSLLLARVLTRRSTWHKAYNRGPYLKGFARVLRSTQALLTLTTRTNTMVDWITTGRGYVRAQLAAATFDLRFHPVSQSLQEYPEMDALRTEMNTLVGTTEPAKLQMLVRVGHTQPPALSPRRDLEAILRS